MMKLRFRLSCFLLLLASSGVCLFAQNGLSSTNAFVRDFNSSSVDQGPLLALTVAGGGAGSGLDADAGSGLSSSNGSNGSGAPRPHPGPNPSPQPDVDPRIAPYVGDWVGHGWSWETRFRQSRRDFTSQLTGGRVESLEGERSKVEGNVMEVAVQHDTEFAFTIDSKGRVSGVGTIVYNVAPNLFGLAALTKQVNEAINIMAKLPAIYKFANEIGSAYLDTMNREWYEKENELAHSVEGLSKYGVMKAPSAENAGEVGLGAAQLERRAAKQLTDMGESEDARAVAYQVIVHRCAGSQGYAAIVGNLPCDIVSIPPGGKEEIEGLDKWAGKFIAEQARDKMKEIQNKQVEKYYKLNDVEKKADATCGSVGPENAAQYKEFVKEKFKDAIKESGFSPASLAENLAAMWLDIPGITKVAYSYKGLIHGPEKRSYNITGYLQPGNPALLHLSMDGDVMDGTKNLQIEYSVNYKKGGGYFPTWSPFLDQPGDVHLSGTFVMPTRPGAGEAAGEGGKAGKGGKATPKPAPASVTSSNPYAVFHQTGTHRNGVKPWQEYEYFWFAHQVTKMNQPRK